MQAGLYSNCCQYKAEKHFSVSKLGSNYGRLRRNHRAAYERLRLFLTYLTEEKSTEYVSILSKRYVDFPGVETGQCDYSKLGEKIMREYSGLLQVSSARGSLVHHGSVSPSAAVNALESRE